MNFWQNSAVHTRTALSDAFREVGIAVIENRGWLLGYVVLGSRPGVLPVMYDPARRMLYLTIDVSYYSDRFTPTRVQLYGQDGKRLHEDEWWVWAPHIPLPANATENVIVVVTDGIIFVETAVNLDAARTYPSDPLPTPVANPTATLVPVLQTIAPVPVATSTPQSANFDLAFVYGNDSIALINQSDRNLNILPLTINATLINKTFTSTWLGAFSRVSLSTFPPQRCLQAWSFDTTLIPPRCQRVVRYAFLGAAESRAKIGFG